MVFTPPSLVNLFRPTDLSAYPRGFPDDQVLTISYMQ
jgi:hypothetical protein